MHELFNLPPNKLLQYCLKLLKDIDKKELYTLGVETLKYYRSTNKHKKQLREWQQLENYWYAALHNKSKVPYDIYKKPEFIVEAWACYIIYSRGYINKILSTNLFNTFTPTVIVDVGCGIGLTTALWSDTFPDATIIGTNVSGKQMKIAKKIAKLFNFTVTTTVCPTTAADIIFASEYFEHFYAPIKQLKHILKMNPKYLIIANSFSAKSVGHFNYYTIDGCTIENKKVGRIFNQYLRSVGYQQQKLGFYNNRPTVWLKG